MSEEKEYTQDELLRLIEQHTHAALENAEETAQHTERTAKNVAFFTWITIIGLILSFLTVAMPLINSL